MNTRREARERALELLYEAESKNVALADLLAELPVEPDPFAGRIVSGVHEHQGDIDALIERLARGWSLARMPAIDRALLRMATYELAHEPDVPTGAAISEAVELAQQFSTDESGKFVNGILASVANEVR